jgi:hypothetical protein
MQETSLLKTFEGRMNLRGAHVEVGCDYGHRRPLAFIGAEFQNDHYVLGL